MNTDKTTHNTSVSPTAAERSAAHRPHTGRSWVAKAAADARDISGLGVAGFVVAGVATTVLSTTLLPVNVGIIAALGTVGATTLGRATGLVDRSGSGWNMIASIGLGIAVGAAAFTLAHMLLPVTWPFYVRAGIEVAAAVVLGVMAQQARQGAMPKGELVVDPQPAGAFAAA